jgi:SNF2 family DNA or RNA helicase
MLSLRFAVRGSRIEVSCSDDQVSSLVGLQIGFPSSNGLTANAFEVDLDDFLLNLDELFRWPEDDPDVQWQEELLNLVESNESDAEQAREWLNDAAGIAGLLDSKSLGINWKGSLTDFQRRDAHKILNMAHGANFSVPGAGKTRGSLAVFQARRAKGQIRQMLVVCPKSAFDSWQYEVNVCFTDDTSIDVMDTRSVPHCDIVLVNYERIPDAMPALLGWVRRLPTMLILDEAHRMKRGPRGAWGSACLALGPYATNRLILTGTPAPNGANDLANLMGFVWPGRGRRAVSSSLEGATLKEASARLAPLFARTTKADLNLPPVDSSMRLVAMSDLHREIYSALLGQASGQWRADPADTLESLGRIVLYLLMAATSPSLLVAGASRYEPLPYRVPPVSPPPNSTLGALLRDLPQYEMSNKYREVLRIVSENATLGRKTLVWSTFVRNLTSLARLLEAYGPAVIHGGTDDRNAELQKFRSDPSCFVLLSNPATLGEGVSLHHECHDAVYVDRDFAAGRYLQSLDRIHRLGLPPDTKTRITVLVSEGTIDEIVNVRLASKLQFMGGVLDDPAILRLADLDEEPSRSVGMNQADIQELLAHLSGPIVTS